MVRVYHRRHSLRSTFAGARDGNVPPLNDFVTRRPRAFPRPFETARRRAACGFSGSGGHRISQTNLSRTSGPGHSRARGLLRLPPRAPDVESLDRSVPESSSG